MMRDLRSSSTRARLHRRAASLLPLLLVIAGLGLPASFAGAVGVAATTPIDNQASATYDVGSTTLTVTSPVNTILVDEIIDVTVTIQSPPVPVTPGASDQVLTYLVTNTGNGDENFELDVNNTITGNDFDPVFASIYLDDGDGIFELSDDTLYTKGGNDPLLDANDPANDSIIVFVLNDIPGSATDGQSGDDRLTATSVTSGAQAPGTVVAGGGDGGAIDAVVGTSGGQDDDQGTYVVAAVSVSIDKQSVILPHAVFGTQPVPGATIQYTLTVTTTGAGTADSLVITDPIPASTLYENNSLFLDDGTGALNLTDPDDTDAGDHNITQPGAITVDLGDVAGGSADRVITFNVMIDPN